MILISKDRPRGGRGACRLTGLLMPVLLLIAAACAPVAPTRYYTLAPIPPSADATQGRPLAVGVGPIDMADYLDRPLIVTRSTAMELQLHEFDLWVEALDTTFPRTVAENLSSLLGTDRVVLMPSAREVRLDYQVEIDVLRFDAMRPGDVMLDAIWRLYGKDGVDLLREGRTRVAVPVAAPEGGDGMLGPAGEIPPVVAAMSEATLRLSREIATAVASARSGPTTRK